MSLRTQFLAGVALALTVTTASFANDAPNADTVVATVNGTDITLGHMIVVRSSLPEQYQSLPDDVLFKGILDQLVEQTAVAQTQGDRVPPRVKLALENERRTLLAADRMATVVQSALTEEAIQTAYEAKYGSAEPEKELNASHILVETEEEAKALVEQLAGGADFAELAKEHSTGPSGPGGGALGWFNKGMMVPAFEAAAMALEVGDVSEPVKTQFGWHVILLNETRDKDAPKLEEVREQLEGEISSKTLEAYIKGVAGQAKITRAEEGTIDPALIKDASLLED